MSKLNVLVYDGSGVSANSRDNLVRALRSFLAHRYDVQLVTPKAIKDDPWTQSCALLVFPGGRDLPYLFDLGGKGNRRIREWVEQGGRYLGICAGAYYACSSIEFEVGTALEVTGERELGFFPGVCRGTVFPGFQYDSDAGAREVELELNRAAWRDHWPGSPDRCDIWYNGGGAFYSPSAPSSSSSTTPAFEVLATYTQHDDAPAAGVLCHVGQGKAVLWGTHPEHSPPPVNPREDELKGRARLSLIRGSLSALDLEVSDAPTTPPRLLPLFLASDEPQHARETAEALASVAQQSSTGEIILADRHDTFTLHPSTEAAALVQQLRSSTEPAPEDPEELRLEPKHICICDDAVPTQPLTPLFDLALYFSTYRLLKPQPAVFGRVLLYSEVVTSTQTMLDKNEAFLSKIPTGLACIASHQVAGRGRGGNTWISPAGCLQFSIVARLPTSAAAQIVFVQYLFGVAVVEAVRGLPGYERLGICLKWPNDIYADMGSDQEGEGMERYKKIGGILVNSSFSDGSFSLVIGCGINTTNPRPTTSVNELIAHHNQRTGSTLPLLRPETLLALVLAKFDAMWPAFVEQGFDPFMDRYLLRWIHSDQVVTLDRTSQPVRIVGITSEHGLLRTLPIQLDRNGREVFAGAAGGVPAYIDLQPDGNRFDIMKGLISARSQ
ncbi:biotin--[acetyl-CoA-carboxylase] ligase BPL1 [Rhodotorula paludigena]|uniref:biotin--[acetyl-CoA-carboxylase] ligase BPL1 n=1 Tax=Rhodotorula paludigena TaxID=86838 RepID=UPI0031826431